MELGTVQRVDLEQKMRSAYLSYAMSVITARALPDVRDGLKPVQRRILYAMDDMGLRHDQPTRKSARIVGEVLGKYHPHGNDAVYDAMVRMAQDFSMRYVLVDGQGNFGSVDGDGAAAMRYTEARLSALGEEMLLDLDKDTVDFVDNFDGSLKEPRVLPAKLPNLLVNGAGGIAVGMATNIPPHNLGEIADAIAYLVDHHTAVDDVTVDELLRFVPGPDFPTGGTILGREGIRQAYATGKGSIVMRAQAHIEDLRGGHAAIIITELPYQVNKAGLVERIADLARNGRIEGIGDLRDESDRTGMRIVIELKRGVEAGPVLRDLLKLTPMQTSFGVNMLALVDGEPRVLSLKRALWHYIEHRQEVITRRSQYELEKARARAHILEGLLKALDMLDEVIDTIRRSRTADTALNNLCHKFGFTEAQARAILDLQLRRLAALERRKIEEEYQEVLGRIAYLEALLADPHKILALVKEDVLDLKQRFGDARRTRICEETTDAEFCPQDLVPDTPITVLLTRDGRICRISHGLGNGGASPGAVLAADADMLQAAFTATTRESVLFFSDQGRTFQLPAHQLPDAAQHPRGLALTSLIHLTTGERLVGAVHLENLPDGRYLCLGTRQGKVKRVALTDLANVGSTGTAVIGLADGDKLVAVALTSGQDDLIFVSQQGRAIRFQEDTVRPQGLAATGMRALTLKEDVEGTPDAVVAMDRARTNGELVVITTYGFAKRTPLPEYNIQGRGGSGVLTVDAAKLDLTGPVAAAAVALPNEELIVTTTAGRTMRVRLSDVPRLDRTSWGRIVTRTRRGALMQVREDIVDSLVRLDLGSDAREDSGEGSHTTSAREATVGRRKASPAPTVPPQQTAPGASDPQAEGTRQRTRRSIATSSRTASSAEQPPARKRIKPDLLSQDTMPEEKSPSRRRRAPTTADQPAMAEPAASKSVKHELMPKNQTTKKPAAQTPAQRAPLAEETPAEPPKRQARRTPVTQPPRRNRSKTREADS